jgi:hypothetical protein
MACLLQSSSCAQIARESGAMIRRIPVTLSILFSLLGIPFSFHGAEASTEQMLLDFGACEIHVVSVDLHETLEHDQDAIRPRDRDHRLTVVRLRILSMIEGVLVLTPSGFSVLLEAKARDVHRTTLSGLTCVIGSAFTPR